MSGEFPHDNHHHSHLHSSDKHSVESSEESLDDASFLAESPAQLANTPDSKRGDGDRLEDIETRRIDAKKNKEIKAAALAEENRLYQLNQINQIKKLGGWYGVAYKSWATINGALKLANYSVGVVGKIIPPIHAVIGGFTTILEIVEAVFLSKEARNTRIIKATNATLGLVLGITSLALSFTPAAPIGILLSTIAAGFSVMKEIYLYNESKNEIKEAELQLKSAIESYQIVSKSSVEGLAIQKFQELITQVKAMPSLSPNEKRLLSNSYNAEIKALNADLTYKMEFSPKIMTARANLQTLKEGQSPKKLSLATTVGSFLGLVAFSVVAFAGLALATAAVFNVVGFSLIAGATVAGIAYKIYQETAAKKSKPPVILDKSTIQHDKTKHQEGPSQRFDIALAEKISARIDAMAQAAQLSQAQSGQSTHKSIMSKVAVGKEPEADSTQTPDLPIQAGLSQQTSSRSKPAANDAVFSGSAESVVPGDPNEQHKSRGFKIGGN